MQQRMSSTQELNRPKLPASIVAVAAVEFLGSLPFLYLCGIALWGTLWVTHDLKDWPMSIVIFGLPFLFSLIAVVTSIGLLWRREWARITTLGLATFPVCACALFLILHHPHDVYGTPFAVRDVSRLIGKILLAILIPAGIWWWVLLTRNAVRSQFR